MKANAGIVSIGEKALLDLLDFSGGKIHSIKLRDDAYWFPREVQIILEHPDLPEVEDGDCLQQITPAYIASYSGQGYEGFTVPVRRVDPPKKEATPTYPLGKQKGG